MSARYKFNCRSCKFECIGAIGIERAANYSIVPMVCRQCNDVTEYKVGGPLDLTGFYRKSLSCRVCHTGDYLDEWDGITCPQCKKPMRALGQNIDGVKPDRYC